MRRVLVWILGMGMIVGLVGQTTAPGGAGTQPAVALGKDGFPTGPETPEGAACDLARAFIGCDSGLFGKRCVRLYADGGKGPAAYADFLKATEEAIQAAGKKAPAKRGGPRAIGKVFAARHLSKEGPASYGYAAFGFEDVMFVDVGVFLQDGSRSLNRTLVVKDRDGKWYADPMPGASPLLSAGLNEEAASTKDFSEAYAGAKK
ncbi:MAG TPA: hypothetical protein VHQ47_13765 [Phycisphaerae bacterium]|nr:hypothetical protein [Phycisphaerae bacterium]